jgi:hypothetical protein
MFSVQGIFQDHLQCIKVHTILDKIWYIVFVISSKLRQSAHSSSNWDFAESIFMAGFAGQGVLNEDPMVWPDGTRPPQLFL